MLSFEQLNIGQWFTTDEKEDKVFWFKAGSNVARAAEDGRLSGAYKFDPKEQVYPYRVASAAA